MRGFLANTDPDWFDFLARREDDEVNFWTPSGRAFKALAVGEPLLFRLKSPRNVVGGFGFFQRSISLPDWYAWEVFAEANGAATRRQFEERLRGLRDRNAIRETVEVGCIVLSRPVFLPPDLWVRLPSDWHPNIVSGKTYDLDAGEGLEMWEAVRNAAAVAPEPFEIEPRLRFGEPVMVRPRLGQAGFRLAVLDAYGAACAVTTEHSLPVLEAAHIMPYAEGGEHAVNNGLLFRRDIHRLYDLGYVTVTPEHRFRVSRSLRDEYANGRVYYEHDGRPLHLPANSALHPARDLLAWHQREVFRG